MEVSRPGWDTSSTRPGAVRPSTDFESTDRAAIGHGLETISDVNLRRLSYFIVVAEELHFGRAAVRLHVAQPSLSRQIRLLEADLGLTLFERSTRRVTLTPAGALLYPEAVRLLDQAERVRGWARGIGSAEG